MGPSTPRATATSQCGRMAVLRQCWGNPRCNPARAALSCKSVEATFETITAVEDRQWPRSSWYSPPTIDWAIPVGRRDSGWKSSPRRTTYSKTPAWTSPSPRRKAARRRSIPRAMIRSAETPSMRRFKKDSEAQRVLANTVRLSTVSADDFDAVFYPGGHGPLWDLAEDRTSVDLIEKIYAAEEAGRRSVPWSGRAAPCEGVGRSAAGQRQGGHGVRRYRGSRGWADQGRPIPGGAGAQGGGEAGTPRQPTGPTTSSSTGISSPVRTRLPRNPPARSLLEQLAATGAGRAR